MRKSKSDIEEQRMDYGENELISSGYDVSKINKSKLHIKFNGEAVYYYPYTGWFSGKSVNDGRGIKNLIKQITQ